MSEEPPEELWDAVAEIEELLAAARPDDELRAAADDLVGRFGDLAVTWLFLAANELGPDGEGPETLIARATDLDPDDAWTALHGATILFDTGLVRAAVETLRAVTAERLNEDERLAALTVGLVGRIAHRRGDRTQERDSEGTLQEAMRRNPEEPAFAVSLALLLLEQGRLEEAHAVATAALERHPDEEALRSAVADSAPPTWPRSPSSATTRATVTFTQRPD